VSRVSREETTGRRSENRHAAPETDEGRLKATRSGLNHLYSCLLNIWDLKKNQKDMECNPVDPETEGVTGNHKPTSTRRGGLLVSVNSYFIFKDYFYCVFV